MPSVELSGGPSSVLAAGVVGRWVPGVRLRPHPAVTALQACTPCAGVHPARCPTVSYLVDPASSICLSQRLSHACLSTNRFNVKPHKAQYNSYNLQDHLPSYLDNCGKSRANTCQMQGHLAEPVQLLVKPIVLRDAGVEIWIILLIVWSRTDDGSFKYLPYQLLMVV